jgi:hypothetical protein
MYNRGERMSPGSRTQSRRCVATGRQQTCARQGKRAGHHRGLRAGHGIRGVTRELGRTSRLLGSNRRTAGDRHNQHPGVWWPTRPSNEPSLAQARRNTKECASTQGTGWERQADQSGWTKVVVATHSTAGRSRAIDTDRRRGEPRPKGPTITLERAREGNAGHDVCAKDRQERR